MSTPYDGVIELSSTTMDIAENLLDKSNIIH